MGIGRRAGRRVEEWGKPELMLMAIMAYAAVQLGRRNTLAGKQTLS